MTKLFCCSSLLPNYKNEQKLVDKVDFNLSPEQVKQSIIKCQEANGGRLIVHGLFARANSVNVNHRLYPLEVLKRETDRFTRQFIRTDLAIGELDHPNYSAQSFKQINLANISHKILHLEWKGCELYGFVQLLETRSGLIARDLLNRGYLVGVSSRGWASLVEFKKHKCQVICSDFELITFDLVTEPSTQGALLVPYTNSLKMKLQDTQKVVNISSLGIGAVFMNQLKFLPSFTEFLDCTQQFRKYIRQTNHEKSKKKLQNNFVTKEKREYPNEKTQYTQINELGRNLNFTPSMGHNNSYLILHRDQANEKRYYNKSIICDKFNSRHIGAVHLAEAYVKEAKRLSQYSPYLNVNSCSDHDPTQLCGEQFNGTQDYKADVGQAINDKQIQSDAQETNLIKGKARKNYKLGGKKVKYYPEVCIIQLWKSSQVMVAPPNIFQVYMIGRKTMVVSYGCYFTTPDFGLPQNISGTRDLEQHHKYFAIRLAKLNNSKLKYSSGKTLQEQTIVYLNDPYVLHLSKKGLRCKKGNYEEPNNSQISEPVPVTTNSVNLGIDMLKQNAQNQSNIGQEYNLNNRKEIDKQQKQSLKSINPISQLQAQQANDLVFQQIQLDRKLQATCISLDNKWGSQRFNMLELDNLSDLETHSFITNKDLQQPKSVCDVFPQKFDTIEGECNMENIVKNSKAFTQYQLIRGQERKFQQSNCEKCFDVLQVNSHVCSIHNYDNDHSISQQATKSSNSHNSESLQSYQYLQSVTSRPDSETDSYNAMIFNKRRLRNRISENRQACDLMEVKQQINNRALYYQDYQDLSEDSQIDEQTKFYSFVNSSRLLEGIGTQKPLQPQQQQQQYIKDLNSVQYFKSFPLQETSCSKKELCARYIRDQKSYQHQCEQVQQSSCTNSSGCIIPDFKKSWDDQHSQVISDEALIANKQKSTHVFQSKRQPKLQKDKYIYCINDHQQYTEEQSLPFYKSTMKEGYGKHRYQYQQNCMERYTKYIDDQTRNTGFNTINSIKDACCFDNLIDKCQVNLGNLKEEQQKLNNFGNSSNDIHTVYGSYQKGDFNKD